ncbi:MAG: HhoA/HhoB/HtrA family serine endopeptidase [Cyanobacteria bacterium P01_D01_bin.123]
MARMKRSLLVLLSLVGLFVLGMGGGMWLSHRGMDLEYARAIVTAQNADRESITVERSGVRATDALSAQRQLSQSDERSTFQPGTAVPSVGKATNFVVDVVERVGPAVVRIDTERTVSQDIPDAFNDPFFRRFFGEDAFPSQPRQFRQQGQGSGFIIDSNGVVLTNAHVVDDADVVTVVLKDGRSFEGTVLGVDELMDLAVVDINGRDLPTVTLGTSSNLHVGDWAIAVGNPLGLDNTVTLGIVSTLDRSSSEVGVPDKRVDFIQTDAAINPGNSGGPLLNQRGEVIGINTAIRANAQGIGFAIPIDTVKTVKDDLARGETVPHPYIGVQMVALTPEVKERFNSDPNSGTFIDADRGVLVVRIVPDSPAAQAGLRAGDVVTRAGDRAIVAAEDLQQVVERTGVGRQLTLTVERNGRERGVSIRTGDLADANR